MAKSLISSSIRLFLEKNGYECFYCGLVVDEDTGTRDHLIPRSSGGRRGTNLVTACNDCNRKKKDRLPSNNELVRWLKLYAPSPIDIRIAAEVILENREVKNSRLLKAFMTHYPEGVKARRKRRNVRKKQKGGRY